MTNRGWTSAPRPVGPGGGAAFRQLAAKTARRPGAIVGVIEGSTIAMFAEKGLPFQSMPEPDARSRAAA